MKQKKLNPNIKKCADAWVCILVCAVKDNVCTRRVKRESERVKEFGIQEMQEKTRNMYEKVNVYRYVICLENILEISLCIGR